MTRTAYRALLILLMKDDPTTLQPDERNALVTFANKYAQGIGYNEWVDAYHYG